MHFLKAAAAIRIPFKSRPFDHEHSLSVDRVGKNDGIRVMNYELQYTTVGVVATTLACQVHGRN